MMESQDVNEDENTHILRAYLGDSFDRNRLECMGVLERRELLLEAKTKLLAQQFGRHRGAYRRERSPPGFWRTDMPTTQELQEDREEAWKMERAKVEDRYREAMQPDRRGAWLFRDE